MSDTHIPPPIFPDITHIPEELRNLPRWCAYDFVFDPNGGKDGKGKLKKPPSSAITGERDGWTESGVTAAEALAGAKRLGKSGIGFIFNGSDFFGVDWDDCAGADGNIHPVVEEWRKWFSTTYQEFSPSHEGLHFICRGSLAKALSGTPLPNAPGVKVEAYSKGRFFCWTGWHIPGAADKVEDCSSGVEKLLAHLQVDTPQASGGGSAKPERPMSKVTARRFHLENLRSLCVAKQGEGNALLNSTSFFAGRAFAAGVLDPQTEKQIKEQILNIALKQWQHPHPEDGANKTVNSGWTSGAAQPLKICEATYECTDLGNAERFVVSHSEDVRFVPAYGAAGWLVWDGRRWNPDGKRHVRKLAHETVRAIYHEAVNLEDENNRKRLMMWSVKSESSRSIASLLEAAQPYLAIEPAELDANPELLNLENGTLDLRSGEVREQKPGDLITRMIPVRYEPRAACPLFEKHLSLVLPDPGVRDYFMEMMAYSYSGSTGEQCIHILHGGGSNGKTTTIDLFRNMAGDYGGVVTRSFFADGYIGVAMHEVADLLGRRSVTCSEFEEGDVLRISVMKGLTSGQSSVVKACRKYGHPFDFRPQAKFILDSNYLLRVDSPDLGTWRRIRVIPFNQTILDKHKDRYFSDKLWAERSGIFNLVIGGLKRWNARGRLLEIPDVIARASGQYKEESDLLARFIEEECVKGDGKRVRLSEFTDEYRKWAKEAANKAKASLGKREMKNRLISRGFIVFPDDKARADFVEGVGLRTLNYGLDGHQESPF
jgi:putative DNA primase/helicase